jgi:hypothetical protein
MTRFLATITILLLASAHAGARVPATVPASATVVSDANAGGASRASRVAAATASATDALTDQLAAQRITANLSVGDFLERTSSYDQFHDAIRSRAHQIGGPRWLDEQTCQVKLEIDGDDVSRSLVKIAAENANRSPMPAQVLASRLRDWKSRSFSSTGASTSYDTAARMRPLSGRAAWEGVGEENRGAAIAAAKLNAAHRLLDSVQSVEIAPGTTLERALANPTVNDRVTSWLATRPITGVGFRPDLLVTVRIAAAGDDLFDVFAEAADAAGIQLPADETARARLRAEFDRRFASTDALGGAYVTEFGEAAAPRAPAAPEPVALPAQPPEWVRGQLDGEGGAASGTSRLRAQQTAQIRALAALRTKIGQLPLNDELTIDQAMKLDPRIAQAVENALVRARVYKVDFREDGSVRARLSMEAADLWDELTSSR